MSSCILEDAPPAQHANTPLEFLWRVELKHHGGGGLRIVVRCQTIFPDLLNDLAHPLYAQAQLFHPAVQFLELFIDHRALDFAGTIVLSGKHRNLYRCIVGLHESPCVMPEPRPIEEHGVIGNDRSAFSAGDILVVVETEATDCPEGAQPPALVESADRLAGILHHGDAMAIRNLHDAIHVTREIRHVNHHNRLGTR